LFPKFANGCRRSNAGRAFPITRCCSVRPLPCLRVVGRVAAQKQFSDDRRHAVEQLRDHSRFHTGLVRGACCARRPRLHQCLPGTHLWIEGGGLRDSRRLHSTHWAENFVTWNLNTLLPCADNRAATRCSSGRCADRIHLAFRLVGYGYSVLMQCPFGVTGLEPDYHNLVIGNSFPGARVVVLEPGSFSNL
jgi:hypothetical protein